MALDPVARRAPRRSAPSSPDVTSLASERRDALAGPAGIARDRLLLLGACSARLGLAGGRPGSGSVVLAGLLLALPRQRRRRVVLSSGVHVGVVSGGNGVCRAPVGGGGTRRGGHLGGGRRNPRSEGGVDPGCASDCFGRGRRARSERAVERRAGRPPVCVCARVSMAPAVVERARERDWSSRVEEDGEPGRPRSRAGRPDPRLISPTRP
jgi:hypothetical protein